MDNSHGYLKLPKQLVKKEDFFLIIEKYDKVEINKNTGKLNNPALIRFTPFVYIPQIYISNITGSCKKYKDLKIPILNGIQSTSNTISYKVLLKLIEVQKKHNLNLGIAKELKS